MPDLLDQRLKVVFSVRNALFTCDTVEEAIDKSIRQAREKIEAQTVSVFLFSKEGTLRRVNIEGVDKDGLAIDKEWFTDEEHFSGGSFTGKAVVEGVPTLVGI